MNKMKGTPRVLIADKWKTWVGLFKDLLAEYHIVSASTLQEASSEIWKSNPPFHVVITDIQLTADPGRDLDLGQHTLLDEIRARGTCTKPVIVVSHGPTQRQVMNVVENYDVDLWYCLDKFPKGGEVFDCARFRDVVEQAASEAIDKERKAHQDFDYEQLQRLAQENFSVLPVFDGRSDPTLCLALLPPLEISQSVYHQIQNSIDSLQQRYPALKCHCIPHDIEREREQVWLAINEASLIIADLTGRDPDVFYELGLCDALAKRLVLLTSQASSIPPHFDVFRSVPYTPDGWEITALAVELRDAIEQCMDMPMAWHPLGKLRWSLSEIKVHRSLTFPSKMDAHTTASPSGTTSAQSSRDRFYQGFVKPILELKQCETEEIGGTFESRQRAEDAWRSINRAGVVLADISTADPETLYTVGLAHAQSRPVILLTSNKEAIPISLGGLDCFGYSLDWDLSTIEQKQAELNTRIGKVLGAYKAADQLPPSLQSTDHPPTTPEPSVPPPSSIWETWEWRSTDGVEIPEGVIRDILLGLNNDTPDIKFSELYRDQICRLAGSREDRRIYSAVELWEQLWVQEPGIPYLPFIEKLATQEFASEMYGEYRDHVAHSMWVYLLGLYLYKQNTPIREALKNEFSERDFLCAWKIAALFHDIGYTCDRGIDREEGFLQSLLNDLQAFIDFPLREYLKARGFELSEEDEAHLTLISGRVRPSVLTLDSIELMPLPGPEERLLNLIEDLAIPTRLAQKDQETPLQNYYELGKTIEPENRDRFRDHGILSALILLYQFQYLDYCLQQLDGIPLPGRINRDAFDKLTEIISGPITQQYAEIVRQAAAAMALHNVNVEIWNSQNDRAKREPYYLGLHDYRISLEENPLAFLLALTDVLQCWDRPKRRYEGDPEGFSTRSEDVRIICQDNIILWSVKPDSVAKKPLTIPSDEIETMSKYLSCRGEDDLSVLIEEK